MPRKTIILISMLILVTLTVVVAWQLISAPKYTVNSEIVSQGSVNSSAIAIAQNKDDFTLNDLYTEIIKIRTDLDSMKQTVSEIQQGATTSSNLPALDNHSDPNSIGELFQYYLDDPDQVAQQLAPYAQARQLGFAEQADVFFAQLPDTDPAWSEASHAYINESISDPALQNMATAQVNEATCKSGVCKVDISLSSINPGGFSGQELYEAENNMLASLAKKFPNTRLRQIEKDGQISFQGYVNDGSLSLPANEIDINDPATIQQIRAILQQ